MSERDCVPVENSVELDELPPGAKLLSSDTGGVWQRSPQGSEPKWCGSKRGTFVGYSDAYDFFFWESPLVVTYRPEVES